MGNKFAIITGIFIAVGAVTGGLFGKLPVMTSADNAVTGAKILADYRDYPQDAGYDQRVAFEKIRRDGFAATRRKARELQ